MPQPTSDNPDEGAVSVVGKSLLALVGGFVAVGVVMFAVLLLVMW